MAGIRKFDNLLYKDYEELSNKLDNVLAQLSNIQAEHKKEIKNIQKENKKLVDELKGTNKELLKKLNDANNLIQKLIEENEKLKNQNNKNSSNSNKPSSTDMFKSKKKTGPNIYNSRIKSSKKTGGQLNHKGHNPIKEDNILTKFTGIVMGDHDTTLNSYGRKRIECNVHLGRYTVEITENTFDAPWAEKMKRLLDTGNNTRKYAGLYGMNGFDEENYKYYSDKFDEIIVEAKKETKIMKSMFYKKKSKQLYSRLEKYKESHLVYLKNFNLPYSNNLSESDLRVYKIKLKVSGCFRSKTGSDCFADALSIIKTSKKKKENI